MASQDLSSSLYIALSHSQIYYVYLLYTSTIPSNARRNAVKTCPYVFLGATHGGEMLYR